MNPRDIKKNISPYKNLDEISVLEYPGIKMQLLLSDDPIVKHLKDLYVKIHQGLRIGALDENILNIVNTLLTTPQNHLLFACRDNLLIYHFPGPDGAVIIDLLNRHYGGNGISKEILIKFREWDCKHLRLLTDLDNKRCLTPELFNDIFLINAGNNMDEVLSIFTCFYKRRCLDSENIRNITSNLRDVIGNPNLIEKLKKAVSFIVRSIGKDDTAKKSALNKLAKNISSSFEISLFNDYLKNENLKNALNSHEINAFIIKMIENKKYSVNENSSRCLPSILSLLSKFKKLDIHILQQLLLVDRDYNISTEIYEGMLSDMIWLLDKSNISVLFTLIERKQFSIRADSWLSYNSASGLFKYLLDFKNGLEKLNSNNYLTQNSIQCLLEFFTLTDNKDMREGFLDGLIKMLDLFKQDELFLTFQEKIFNVIIIKLNSTLRFSGSEMGAIYKDLQELKKELILNDKDNLDLFLSKSLLNDSHDISTILISLNKAKLLNPDNRKKLNDITHFSSIRKAIESFAGIGESKLTQELFDLFILRPDDSLKLVVMMNLFIFSARNLAEKTVFVQKVKNIFIDAEAFAKLNSAYNSLRNYDLDPDDIRILLSLTPKQGSAYANALSKLLEHFRLENNKKAIIANLDKIEAISQSFSNLGDLLNINNPLGQRFIDSILSLSKNQIAFTNTIKSLDSKFLETNLDKLTEMFNTLDANEAKCFSWIITFGSIEIKDSSSIALLINNHETINFEGLEQVSRAMHMLPADSRQENFRKAIQLTKYTYDIGYALSFFAEPNPVSLTQAIFDAICKAGPHAMLEAIKLGGSNFSSKGGQAFLEIQKTCQNLYTLKSDAINDCPSSADHLSCHLTQLSDMMLLIASQTQTGGEIHPEAKSLIAEDMKNKLTQQIDEHESLRYSIKKSFKEIPEMNALANKTWNQIIKECKSSNADSNFSLGLFKKASSRNPKVNLICASIVEFDKNVKFTSGILNLEKLMIAQQKRDAIKLFQNEMMRLKSNGKPDLKIAAYARLIQYISASLAHVSMNMILELEKINMLDAQGESHNVFNVLRLKRGDESKSESEKVLDAILEGTLGVSPELILKALSAPDEKEGRGLSRS